MRFKEVSFTCNRARELCCDLEWEEKKIQGGSVHRLGNTSKIKQILSVLDPIESLATTITNIRNTSIGFVQVLLEAKSVLPPLERQSLPLNDISLLMDTSEKSE